MAKTPKPKKPIVGPEIPVTGTVGVAVAPAAGVLVGPGAGVLVGPPLLVKV